MIYYLRGRMSGKSSGPLVSLELWTSGEKGRLFLDAVLICSFEWCRNQNSYYIKFKRKSDEKMFYSSEAGREYLNEALQKLEKLRLIYKDLDEYRKTLEHDFFINHNI